MLFAISILEKVSSVAHRAKELALNGVTSFDAVPLPAHLLLIHAVTTSRDSISNQLQKRVSITNSGKVGIGTCAPTTSLQVNGSMSAKVALVTASYSIEATDFGILANESLGPLTVTLPAASTALGMLVLIKKVDSSPTQLWSLLRARTR